MRPLFVLLYCFFIISIYSQDKKHAIILKPYSLDSNSHKTTNFEENFSVLNKNLNAIKEEIKVSSKNKLIKLTFSKNMSMDSILSIYNKTEMFEYVEPDYISFGSGVEVTPNDNYFNLQYSLKNDGSFSTNFMSNNNILASPKADINIEGLWDYSTGDPELIVAVIDSGMNLTHEDLAGRFWTNEDEIEGNNIDDDGNGYIDDVNGWDFMNNDNDPTDDHGHGTNVGSIALATGNNSIGIAGVNWNSKIMVLKSLDENNSGSYSAMIESIYYAVDNGAKVINFSIGGSGYSEALREAVNYCYDNNVVFVACMMNYDNEVTYYPAGYKNTIAVGATDPRDYRASPFNWTFSDGSPSGSNFGNHIDLVAPGLQIAGASNSSNSAYNYWSGTSQATPLVAGVASLLISVDQNLSVDDIKNYLINSADDEIGESSEDTVGWDKYYGHGRLNATNAISQVLGVDKINSYQVYIYPNPTDAFFIVNYPFEVTIQIYDPRGVLIKTTQNKKVNTSSFNSGVYFVKVSNDSGQIYSKKLIKI